MSETPAAYDVETRTALKTWRCWQCGRVLARVWLVTGCTVEIKCKCNAINTARLVDKESVTR